jgi:nitrogen permease regulator 2-like protein
MGPDGFGRMYQCVMMIDIFQFSNVVRPPPPFLSKIHSPIAQYTLCRPVMWLFTDPAIYEECGPYVHKSNNRHQNGEEEGENGDVKDDEPIPWPRLAWYYARLKPPLTVGKWITQYDIDLEKIDVRRFISFGVIKVCHNSICHYCSFMLMRTPGLPPACSSMAYPA